MDLKKQLDNQKQEWLHKDIQWLEKRFHDIQHSYVPCNTKSTARRYVKDINTAKRQMIKTQACQAKTIIAFHTPAYQVELVGHLPKDLAMIQAVAAMRNNNVPIAGNLNHDSDCPCSTCSAANAAKNNACNKWFHLQRELARHKVTAKDITQAETELRFGEYSFTFKQMTNGSWYVQAWLTNAAFSVMHQARFDHYAFRFKDPTGDYGKLPAKLTTAVQNAFVAIHKPEKKNLS